MQMKVRSRALCLLGALLTPAIAGAQAIDFETVPGGAPADQLAITTQYEASFGVTFGLDNDDDGALDPGLSPFLELVGGADPGTGFANHQVGDDQADAGFEARLGSYFLRFGTGETGDGDSALLIVYTQPVDAASGDLWDIDGSGSGTERWLIEALDSGGSTIDSVLSPEGVDFATDPFEGRPWTWSFSRGTADIHAIRIDFVGTKTSNVGLAFDRFSPSTAAPSPVPISPWLPIGLGAALLLTGRRYARG